MRFRIIAVLCVALLFAGSLLMLCVPAQYDENMTLTWSDSITVGKTYKWVFHEVTWPDLYYMEEAVVTGSTIEFKILGTMPDNSSAYENYCAGFDPVIEVKINGNVRTYSDLVSDVYSTYLAYLLIPLEASYPLYSIYMGPTEYLPLVIPTSSGGEISESDVVVTEDDLYTYVYADGSSVTHDARIESTTGHCPLWQAWDPADPNNYITLTMDGYTGEIPEMGSGTPVDDDTTTDDDVVIDDDWNWEDWEDWEDNWSEDWDWEDWDIDWDEYDYEVDDWDMDVWFNGTDDLDFEDIDWEDLEKEFKDLEDWDWEDEGLEDLGLYFELNSDGDVNHIHLEIDIDLEKGVDSSTVKLYYYDEETGEWVKIETSAYNDETGKIEADIDHLTVFAAMAEEPEKEKPDDAPSGFLAVLVILGLLGTAVVFSTRRKK